MMVESGLASECLRWFRSMRVHYSMRSSHIISGGGDRLFVARATGPTHLPVG